MLWIMQREVPSAIVSLPTLPFFFAWRPALGAGKFLAFHTGPSTQLGPPPKVGGPLATFPPVLGGIGKESTRTCLCICRSTTCRDWPPHRGGPVARGRESTRICLGARRSTKRRGWPPHTRGGQWQEGREVGPPQGGATLHATGPPPKVGGAFVWQHSPPFWGG